MQIKVNGKAEEVKENSTIKSFIEGTELKIDQIIIALNDDVIEVENYPKIALNDGDSIDVMSFIGGG